MTINLHAPMVAADSDCGPLWSLDPTITHLNHGSFGAVPVRVQQEQQRLLGIAEADPVRWFSSLPHRVEQARNHLGSILDVDTDRMAFTFNASAAASAVFQSMAGSSKVHVQVTDHGYGALSMGARRLAERTGGRFGVSRIPLEASAVEVQQIIEQDLDQNPTTLLVIDQITSATARRFPVEEICRAARARGVLTLVDGAHGPGVLPQPVSVEADFWIGNLHKFGCAPRGAAVIVARNDTIDLFPPIDSWGAELPFPERFDHVGTMDVTPWLAAPFAWDYIEETLQWQAVQERSSQLLDVGVERISVALQESFEQPIPDVGQPVGPMRLLRLPPGLGLDRLDADGLRIPFIEQSGIAAAFTSFHGEGFVRISAHAYNTLYDYEHFASVGVPVLQQWSQKRLER